MHVDRDVYRKRTRSVRSSAHTKSPSSYGPLKHDDSCHPVSLIHIKPIRMLEREREREFQDGGQSGAPLRHVRRGGRWIACTAQAGSRGACPDGTLLVHAILACLSFLKHTEWQQETQCLHLHLLLATICSTTGSFSVRITLCPSSHAITVPRYLEEESC
ncbi:hypothetical protein LZ30DRAFT_399508 [Colletotrichum cereale]|nr:hypothetical protein LZ30DRAFT_399508 [Colletotrichum cereale]